MQQQRSRAIEGEAKAIRGLIHRLVNLACGESMLTRGRRIPLSLRLSGFPWFLEFSDSRTVRERARRASRALSRREFGFS